MKGDVLRVGDVGRRGEAPSGHVPRRRGPEARSSYARDHRCRRDARAPPREDAHAVGPPHAREAVDVVCVEALVPRAPALAPVRAREDRPVARPREQRAALRLDQEGVDVLVGQRAASDVPPRTARNAPRHATPSIVPTSTCLEGAGERWIVGPPCESVIAMGASFARGSLGPNEEIARCWQACQGRRTGEFQETTARST